MGMFDNFVPIEKIVCPECKIELKNEDTDLDYKWVLQSKVLDCSLDTYKEGETINLESMGKSLSIKDGWIEAHDYCKTCKKMIYFKLIIEDGVWVKTEFWKTS